MRPPHGAQASRNPVLGLLANRVETAETSETSRVLEKFGARSSIPKHQVHLQALSTRARSLETA